MSKTFVQRYAKENGLRTQDATKPCIITVNATDVRKAKMKNAKDCAFACAFKRAQGAEAAFVFRSSCYVQKGDKLIRYRLPLSVQKEIVSFDRTGDMEPGNFHVTPHSPCARLDSLKKNTANRNGPNGRHARGRASRRTAQLRHVTKNVRGLREPASR